MATQVQDLPTEAPERGDVLAKLAEDVGARLGGSAIFGTPVEREGVTVIPVGTIRFGFGGGRGSDPEGKGEGQGGGAMGRGGPAGYIEVKDGRSRFVPAVHPARMLALICATLLGGLVVMAIDRRAASAASRRGWRPGR